MKYPHTILDPLFQFPDLSTDEIFSICGFLPGWVVKPQYAHLPLREAMTQQYGPLFELVGGIVTSEGIFEYPDDPPLYPLIKIQRNAEETFFQYPSAIVAFVTSDSTFLTRMD